MSPPAAHAVSSPRAAGLADEARRAVSVSVPSARRAPGDVGALVAQAHAALRAVAHGPTLPLEDVARWCAEVGGVDPCLERAALAHALDVVSVDAAVEDIVATLRARLVAAGPLLPSLVGRGGMPRVLASIGLDDVDPPAAAVRRAVSPRIARFYWQRLRSYVAWSASCAWS
jgi:hypothetical protein